MVPYNGAQPADPTVAPSGSAVYSSISAGVDIQTFLTAAGGGISQLSVARSANASSTVGSLTFARLYSSGSVALIDADMSLSGGGGALIVPALSSTVGVAFVLSAMSLKLPLALSTVKLSQSLVNGLVDWWTGQSSTAPQFGINTGGASIINLYSGSAPTNADDAATGTLLAAIPIGASNVYAAAAAGSAALNTAPSVLASATGTVGYLRWVKTQGSSTFTIQGSVGTSGADFNLNTLSLTSGVTTVALNDATITI